MNDRDRTETATCEAPLVAPPADVIACGASPDARLCSACIDAYRNGIAPGETACEERERKRTAALWARDARP